MFVDNPNVQSVEALGITEAELRDSQYAYTIDSATDSEGKVKVVSWYASPGVFVYNRNIAKQYIGSSDPKDVQVAISTWDKFLETARRLKKASEGKVKIVAGIDDLYRPFMSNSDQAWVYNGTLTIDSNRLEFMDYAKIIADEELTHSVPQWYMEWFDGMENDSILGYFLPTWGVEWIMPINDTSGWAITEGPQSYVWGGNYFVVSKDCDVRGTAAEIIRYFTLDEDSVDYYARDSKNFVNNYKVVSGLIEDKWRLDILGDQDYYSIFNSVANGIKFESHMYDYTISQCFQESVYDYISGELSKEEALRQFKKDVKDTFYDMTIE